MRTLTYLAAAAVASSAALLSPAAVAEPPAPRAASVVAPHPIALAMPTELLATRPQPAGAKYFAKLSYKTAPNGAVTTCDLLGVAFSSTARADARTDARTDAAMRGPASGKRQYKPVTMTMTMALQPCRVGLMEAMVANRAFQKILVEWPDGGIGTADGWVAAG